MAPSCKTTSSMFHALLYISTMSLCTFFINWIVVFKGLLYLAVMKYNTLNYVQIMCFLPFI